MRMLTILAFSIVLAGCSADQESSGDTSQEPAAKPENTRPVVSASDDINVDLIAVVYGPESNYVGNLAFNIGTGRPRLPDPEKEVFIMVVREPPSANIMADFNMTLEPGIAYQWLGGGEFHEIMPVDLSLTDEELSKLFGVGRPSPAQALIDTLEAREIDVAGALEMLASLQNVDYRDIAGRAAIHQASYWGHAEVVAALVERGADINMPGMNGGRPLSSAAAGGNPEIVTFLLDAGADIYGINDYGDSALHSSMYNKGCVACAEILIANGADLSLRNRDGQTPVSLAKSQPDSFMDNKAQMLEFLESLDVDSSGDGDKVD